MEFSGTHLEHLNRNRSVSFGMYNGINSQECSIRDISNKRHAKDKTSFIFSIYLMSCEKGKCDQTKYSIISQCLVCLSYINKSIY